ncbi:hypothetical protein M1L60_12105 [Actinoplanes sp. TRM 88003]|uniref:Uncharacterized protein n=1 Tax=Paractinoplanes aksuensis TaxID=2939490 RepID=A0ABT1DKG6_9ACTN|nr:hypothetical protein [Actinoplanes aksuensis]MCO8271337.1 hypothetical protein [Actinoplanes aksuensis]
MLVSLNSNTGHHDFTATATDLPINPAGLPATVAGPRPAVAYLGHPGRVAGLSTHLPSGWTLRRAAGLDDIGAEEIVLIAAGTIRDVETARRVLPRRSMIVALVDEEAPAEIVAGVLTAGADACVRGGQPAILAGHLVACRRRDRATRWSQLNEQTRRY